MSSTNIREAVLKYLRKRSKATEIGAMASEIRKRNARLRDVSDFDFRSTVLRMLAAGDLRTTPTNRIVVPRHQ